MEVRRSTVFCLCWQVMLKDMEHNKKTLEEELQKTSEVTHGYLQMYIQHRNMFCTAKVSAVIHRKHA